jgi:hypothetical protein
VGIYVLATDGECENHGLEKWRGLRDRAILLGPVRTKFIFTVHAKNSTHHVLVSIQNNPNSNTSQSHTLLTILKISGINYIWSAVSFARLLMPIQTQRNILIAGWLRMILQHWTSPRSPLYLRSTSHLLFQHPFVHFDVTQ